jgi:hypothetical protein
MAEQHLNEGEITWSDTPTSGNVNKIGYDKEQEVMYVDFKKTSMYKYAGVPEEKWNAALNAPSIGKFVHDELRDKHKATKI